MDNDVTIVSDLWYIIELFESWGNCKFDDSSFLLTAEQQIALNIEFINMAHSKILINNIKQLLII